MSRLANGVLMAGMAGNHVPRWLAAAIADGLAAVCLFAENTPDVATTRALTDALRAARGQAGGTVAAREALGAPGVGGPRAMSAGPVGSGGRDEPLGPPIIAIDEEGGNVTRLQAHAGSSLPGAAALGAVDDEELTLRCAERLGEVLAVAGIDLDLAPCLDVASEPDNPVIGVRSFGPDPDLVRRHGRAFAAGLARAGVACCGKHYPGHGDTRRDSHLDLPVLRVSESLLRHRDEAPFLSLVGDLDAVMTGHLVVPSRGAEAASLSAWATGRLRSAGFDGPIVTDALGMRAIGDRMGLGEACVAALEAGADLLCLDAPQLRDAESAYREAVAAIDGALADGRLVPAALAASGARIARLARRRSLPGPSAVAGAVAGPHPEDTLADSVADAGSRALEALALVGAEAADRAIRVRGDAVLAGPPLVFDIRQRPSRAASRSVAFETAFRRTWVAAEVVVPLDAGEIREAVDVAPVGHEVVVLTRSARADETEGAALAAVLASRPDALVVHTGVPAAAPAAPRLVCPFGEGAANADALVRLLAGADGGDSPAARRERAAGTRARERR